MGKYAGGVVANDSKNSGVGGVGGDGAGDRGSGLVD